MREIAVPVVWLDNLNFTCCETDFCGILTKNELYMLLNTDFCSTYILRKPILYMLVY